MLNEVSGSDLYNFTSESKYGAASGYASTVKNSDRKRYDNLTSPKDSPQRFVKYLQRA